MSADPRSFTGAVSRGAAAIVTIAVVLVAYFWFIEPRVAAYVLARNDVRTQQARLQNLQSALARGARIPVATDEDFVAEFNRRMSADDKVSDVIASIARSLNAGNAGTRVKGLLIEAGQRQRLSMVIPDAATRAEADTQPHAVTSGATEEAAAPGNDPRARLFPVPLQFTPVAVTFESDFEAAGEFLWELRNAPTLVEVSSLTIDRGLPLLKVRARLLIYQRLASGDGDDASGGPRAAAGMPPPGLASNQGSR